MCQLPCSFRRVKYGWKKSNRMKSSNVDGNSRVDEQIKVNEKPNLDENLIKYGCKKSNVDAK